VPSTVLIDFGDGRVVLDDVSQAVAEKDPDAAVGVEFRRAGSGGTVNVSLSPRTP